MLTSSSAVKGTKHRMMSPLGHTRPYPSQYFPGSHSLHADSDVWSVSLLYVPGLQGCCVANSVPFGQTCPLGQAAGVTVVPLQYLPTNKSRVKRKDA